MRFLLGAGTLRPELRQALEAEGLVLLEEGLPGSIRYWHFKAPGKRFHGKVTPERLALGISEKRLVVYCRSGRTELIDSPFTQQRLRAVEVSAEGEEKLVLRVDYDEMGEPNVSGEIRIRAKTPKAPLIVAELRARLPA
ncbi:MAG: hypothetical protein ACR2G3_07260 [Solirubrobacterales bacterium]